MDGQSGRIGVLRAASLVASLALVLAALPLGSWACQPLDPFAGTGGYLCIFPFDPLACEGSRGLILSFYVVPTVARVLATAGT